MDSGTKELVKFDVGHLARCLANQQETATIREPKKKKEAGFMLYWRAVANVVQLATAPESSRETQAAAEETRNDSKNMGGYAKVNSGTMFSARFSCVCV
jgi:hypothetical protein